MQPLARLGKQVRTKMICLKILLLVLLNLVKPWKQYMYVLKNIEMTKSFFEIRF
jgi:hypothetical protein